jgi:hypothetical protein
LSVIYTTGMGTGDGSMSVTFSRTVTYSLVSSSTVAVPAGYKFMTVDMYGARGGSAGAALGGYGARVQATFAVVPGTIYYFNVGGHGADSSSGSSPGGFNGGIIACLSIVCFVLSAFSRRSWWCLHGFKWRRSYGSPNN